MLFYRRMDNGVLEERLLASEAEEQPNLKRRIWVESKLIWRIAFPSILARVTSFGMVVVTQLFIGHVSALELASYALVQSVLVRFVNGILVIKLLILFYV
jgi:MATE family multidrug resistance protein